MHCPSCNHENRAERRFCGRCGTALPVPCPACGATNDPGENFCGGCGVRLQSAAAPDTTLLVGERRQLTVLFCDLVGSTPLSQRLDAEEFREIIARVQRTAGASVARFGGH